MIAAAAGWNSSQKRSWKLDTSTTTACVAPAYMLGESGTDVARRRGIDPRCPEHGGGRLGDRGLPVRARDGRYRDIQVPPGELDLAPHGDPPFQGLDDGQGAFGEARAGDHEVDAGEQDRVPSATGDGEALLQGDFGLIPGVDRHRHLAIPGESSGGQTGDPSTEDEHPGHNKSSSRRKSP